MLQSLLRGLAHSSLYRDFRFQIRLTVVVGALFVFVFPSLVGMNLFYLDLFSGHPDLRGFPEQPAALAAFINLAGDAAVREVVLGLVFSAGLICILGACHGEARLAPLLNALGLLLVMYSLYFLLVASDRCIPGLGCSREFFFTAAGLAGAFGLGAVMIAHSPRRMAAWFALPYIPLLIYQDYLWLVTLARTPRIVLSWETTFAVLLGFITMLIPILLALIRFTPRRS